MKVIALLKDAFQNSGLPLYVAPYGVLPTSYECGVVEVVPNSKSRSTLGETSGKFQTYYIDTPQIAYQCVALANGKRSFSKAIVSLSGGPNTLSQRSQELYCFLGCIQLLSS